MTYVGATQMPDAYILKRWTWSAEEDLVEEAPNQPAMMPEESRKQMKLVLMCNDFKFIALSANQSEDGRRIVATHLKAMKKASHSQEGNREEG